MIGTSKQRTERHMESKKNSTYPTFSNGTIISSKYMIESLIGRGGFSDVYKIRELSSGKLFALKTEFLDSPKKGLAHELSILTHLNHPYFPHIYDQGTDRDVTFCVMDLFGISLCTYRREYVIKSVPLGILLPIAEQTLRIIEEFHSLGFVHRDIKPSNFVLRRSKRYPLCLIDFGLSKVHIDPNTHKPIPMGEPRFLGTKKYASLNSHDGIELGRRDDLISWFYSIIELAKKRLPWSTIKSKEDTAQMKRTLSSEILCRGLPKQFEVIIEYLSTLRYEDKPDYDHVLSLLSQARKEASIPSDFDWVSFYDSVNPREDDNSNREVPDEEFLPGSPLLPTDDGGPCCCSIL